MKKKPFPLLGLLLALALSFGVGCSSDDQVAEVAEVTWQMVEAGGRHHYQLSSNTAHTCGITTLGHLFCWGAGGEGQLGTGNRTSFSTPQQVGESDGWTDITVGGGFTCGIDTGQLFCWGSNRSYSKYDNPTTIGLLGLGAEYDTADSVLTPTQVGSADDWNQVHAGTNHACGIRDDQTDRTLWCWGRGGSDGVLGNDGDFSGDGYYNNRNAPTQEEGEYTDWATVVAGFRSSTFGIRDDGTDRTLWSFGQGVSGSTSGDQPVQEGVETDWASITLGGWEFCGIRDDETDQTLWCAGNNRHGQIGNGTDSSVNFGSIAQIPGTLWSDVNMGTGHTCGILDTDMYCWGRNHDNELGLGTDLSGNASCVTHDLSTNYPFDCYSPELVNESNTWTSVSAGTGHTCGINSDNELRCWGSNLYGQVGKDDKDSSTSGPTLIKASM